MPRTKRKGGRPSIGGTVLSVTIPDETSDHIDHLVTHIPMPRPAVARTLLKAGIEYTDPATQALLADGARYADTHGRNALPDPSVYPQRLAATAEYRLITIPSVDETLGCAVVLYSGDGHGRGIPALIGSALAKAGHPVLTVTDDLTFTEAVNRAPVRGVVVMEDVSRDLKGWEGGLRLARSRGVALIGGAPAEGLSAVAPDRATVVFDYARGVIVGDWW